MISFIFFLVFMIILGLAISVAFSTYVAQNKGLSFKTGLLWGIFLPFFGIIVLALKSSTDLKIAQEMYERRMISQEDLAKTTEILLKKQK